MMNTSQTDRTDSFEQGPVTIQALRSLSRQQAERIRRTVADVSGRWAMESHYDYEGYLSILLSPAELGREYPVHIVSGTIARIEVSTMDGDTLHQLGAYATIGQAAVRLRAALAGASPQAPG